MKGMLVMAMTRLARGVGENKRTYDELLNEQRTRQRIKKEKNRARTKRAKKAIARNRQ